MFGMKERKQKLYQTQIVATFQQSSFKNVPLLAKSKLEIDQIIIIINPPLKHCDKIVLNMFAPHYTGFIFPPSNLVFALYCDIFVIFWRHELCLAFFYKLDHFLKQTNSILIQTDHIWFRPNLDQLKLAPFCSRFS